MLLTYIVMPRLQGIALALKVGRDYLALETTLMAGYADQEWQAHNLEALVHETITKHFTLDEIRAVVVR